MIDPGLIAAAKKAVEAKPRQFLTPAILLAVVLQESRGVPYFTDTKPGSLYALNVADAIVHTVRDGHGNPIRQVVTGLKEPEIRQAIIIPEIVDGWRVPRSMVGQRAKFRFEYGYWQNYGHLEKMHRFRMSCSWGLTQIMGPNITDQLIGDPADLFIQRFAADVALQLLYGAGIIEGLLEKSHGSVDHAYRGYNSGQIDSTSVAVINRAKAVERSALEIALQIGSTNNHG